MEQGDRGVYRSSGQNSDWGEGSCFSLAWDVKLQHEGRVLEEGQLSPGLDVPYRLTHTQNKIHPWRNGWGCKLGSSCILPLAAMRPARYSAVSPSLCTCTRSTHRT